MNETTAKRKGGVRALLEMWPLLALIAGWFVLQRWILPSLGVPT